ncbi:peptidoglycan-binding protein [Streptomyces sp. NPDC088732]|uniref:peptidoglycan-binding domain-containing protein n=1 Tax=Streptomyces sp. NPDC088732 TaxID=3365879 RepID=UPI00380EE7DB
MIEPTRVIPARESAAAGDSWEESLGLFRPAGAAPRPAGSQRPRPAPAPPAAPPAGEATRRHASSRALRLTGLGALVTGAGAAGFGLALALSSPGATLTPAAPAPPVTTAPPAAGTASGVLREGDSGPAVSELQARLLRIPDVYTGGPVDGRFDRRLTAAVARFQVWYGIRGDESGEYGDATRRDLESRTPG